MGRIVTMLCLFGSLWSAAFSQTGFPVHVDTGYINVDGDGGKLYYEIAGEGENIVLIHDGPIHHEIWDEQFTVLAQDYRVIRYDRRGYGKSPAPRAAFSNIDDLHRLFHDLNIDQAVVFGMSAGGGVAMDFTLEYPEKVSALVLVGAVVSGYGYSSHMLTRGGRVPALGELLADPQKVIQYFGWEDPYQIYPENSEAKKRCYELLKANPQNARSEKYRYSRPPERPAVNFLSEIQVPSLVLVGEYDIPDVHAHSGAIEAGIPDTKREIIPNCGHLLPLEQPEAFNAAVFNFLSRIVFFEALNSGDIDGAVQYFRRMREAEPDIVLFEEVEMNAMGYRLLQNDDVKKAIEILKLNTMAYPNSGNVYDSLGEAYLKDGQRDLAIQNYRRALEINPRNTNAEQVLKELKEGKSP